MSERETLGLDADLLEQAASSYTQALRSGDPRAEATADVFRAASASGFAGQPLRDVLSRPDAYGPPQTRDVLLEWATQMRDFPDDSSLFCARRQLRQFVDLLVIQELINASSLGTATARMLRERADGMASAHAVLGSLQNDPGDRPVGTERPARARQPPTPPDQRTDAELAFQATAAPLAADRDAAFAAIYTRYAHVVLDYCHRHAGPDDADEAASDTWMAVYTGLRTLSAPDKLHGWIRGVARHKCAEYLRRRAGTVRRSVAIAELLDGAEEPFEDPQGLLEESDRLGRKLRLLETVTQTLTPDEQRLYRLAYEEGLSGSALARNLHTDGPRASRMKHRLQGKLADGFQAVLFYRYDPGTCARLRGVLSGERDFTQQLRMSIVRHVSHCEQCQETARNLTREWAP